MPTDTMGADELLWYTACSFEQHRVHEMIDSLINFAMDQGNQHTAETLLALRDFIEYEGVVPLNEAAVVLEEMERRENDEITAMLGPFGANN